MDLGIGPDLSRHWRFVCFSFCLIFLFLVRPTYDRLSLSRLFIHTPSCTVGLYSKHKHNIAFISNKIEQSSINERLFTQAVDAC